MKRGKTNWSGRAILWGGGIGLVLFLGFVFLRPAPQPSFVESGKEITVIDTGLEFSFKQVREKTVGAFLAAYGLQLETNDSMLFSPDTSLFSGMTLVITRAHDILVQADGHEETFYVQARQVDAALAEAGVTLDEDDIVKPQREAVAYRGQEITIIRVDIREEQITQSVAFVTKITEDNTLSWRKKVVTQKGEKGTEQQTYRVSSHDGQEVSRKLLKTEVTKEPVPEVVTQGTYVKLGKSHSGGASWYAWTGTMAAANPWLPKGSFVKVTNVENGKSVIVVINDRGPFVPGRIIDLDKVAFQKIASTGAGVIQVKMEEIVN